MPLVIRDHHQLVHHNGICKTLKSIRQIHWTTDCKRCDQKMCGLSIEGRVYPTPPLSDLPEERVSEGPLFYNTGVTETLYNVL